MQNIEQNIEKEMSGSPNRTNNRWINDLTITLSLTPDSWNIFSNFLYHIWEKIMENKLSNLQKKVTLLDIWCWQWTLLEDIMEVYNIRWIWISKYNERDDNTRVNKAEYNQYEIINKLPNNIWDNSLDFVLSLYSLQYIEKALDVIQDIYKKLKIWWKAILSLWSMWHIDPYLLDQIEKENKSIIINSIFTRDLCKKEILDLYKDWNIDNNTEQYVRGSGRIHILYIEKKESEKNFLIPLYKSTKDIRISQQNRHQYITNDASKHYEILKERKDNQGDSYTHDSSDNLRLLSYTFIKENNVDNYISNAYKKNKAFTLIELLIVISIISILSVITLQFNRSKIKDMEAMNDREQRLSRHRKENNIITNSNFINEQKISTGIQFVYLSWATSISEIIWSTTTTYKFKNHSISGNLTITKQPLSL